MRVKFVDCQDMLELAPSSRAEICVAGIPVIQWPSALVQGTSHS